LVAGGQGHVLQLAMDMQLKREIRTHVIWAILAVLSLVGLYFSTRLVNLTIIPIFTDEAIYLRWGQIALADPRWRFISLLDGKQPLLIWLFLPALKLIADPLVAGRMVSIFAGCMGMIGMGFLGYSLSKNFKTAVVASSLYILIPFFLVYDRLAIYDSLFTAISIWTLFLTYWLAKKQRLDLALLVGSAIGVGLLTKSYAQFMLILLPLTLLLAPWKKFWPAFLKWLGLSLIVVIQAKVYESILFLSELRHNVSDKNLQFIYSWSEFWQHPLDRVFGNLQGLSMWLISYLTIPLSILVAISLLWHIKHKWREGIFFAAYFTVPFLALAFFGKVIYPRFILFMVPPLMVSFIAFIDYLLKSKFKNVLILLGVVTLVPLVFFDFKLLTDPIHAPLPTADRQQFINDWPAGYGIPQVVQSLKQEADKQHVTVGTDGTFGLYPMALELYLGTNPNITFKPYWPLNEFPKDLLEDAKREPTFLLFKEKQTAPSDWPLELIGEYQRGDGPTYLRFFRVVPKT